MQRESMEFDVIIVGAGPAGLSAAIKLKQLSQATSTDLRICILEKGAEVGAHILSGAVIEPRALDELLPQWREQGAPLKVTAVHDQFIYLTKTRAFKLPTPSPMQNHGNYIASLGNLCRWLAQQAEILGVEIYPGFPASDILYDQTGKVIGVLTQDMGLDKYGNPSATYQPGMQLFAKQTLFAEGCRGSLSEQIIAKFNLRQGVQPQTYGLGIKELWRITPQQHKLGTVMHSIGWPLDNRTYGGSFAYHFEDHQLAIGLVIGLDYSNPWLDPFEEFQRFKTHPLITAMLTGGERINYGAKTIIEGGFQAIPKLTFPGGALIGDSAGFVNVPKIKGTHTAMKSGMCAAEGVFQALSQPSQAEILAYPKALQNSWVWQELYAVRNIRPSFHWSLWPALAYSAIDTYIFKGKLPWTFKHHADHTSLKNADTCAKITYPKADNIITFDRASSLYLSGTFHAENQPGHLKLKDPQLPIDYNLKLYQAPEQRYCPAGVYEIVYDSDNKPRLQINSQNCLHCKTCDIKDPKQNIVWTTPEGGGGPNYSGM